jgi:hypothetical protein
MYMQNNVRQGSSSSLVGFRRFGASSVLPVTRPITIKRHSGHHFHDGTIGNTGIGHEDFLIAVLGDGAA